MNRLQRLAIICIALNLLLVCLFPPYDDFSMQHGVLWFVALNLILIALFPPFQNYAAISQATLPSFEGLYFLFADNSQRQLVGAILYLEVCIVLINGGILWLLLKGRGQEKLTAEKIRVLSKEIQAIQRKG